MIERLAQAVDPLAFSPSVRQKFIEAAKVGEPSSETIYWMPRIVAARQVASRVMDVLKPTDYMLAAADALIETSPESTPGEIFNMMIYAERDLALRVSAPGVQLEDISPDEYLMPASPTFG